MEKITLTLAEGVQGLGKAGERVTLALQPADVHDPTELPTYLAGYKPFQYRADEASPVVLVDNDEDKYRTFDSDDAFRRVNVKGSTSGKVNEVDPKSSLASYKVVERFIGSFVPAQTQGQTGNAYNPQMAAARRARRALELDREIDVFTMLGTLTSFATAQRTTLAAGREWNGGTNSNPIEDLQNQIEASAQEVSAIWMNQKVAHLFMRHPEVKDHMRQFLGDSPVTGAAREVYDAGRRTVDFEIPGLPPIKVSAAKVLNETTSALDYVFPDVVTLVTVPPGEPTDGEEIATTYTFRRRGPSGTGFEVREFTVEDRGSLGGTMIVVSQADLAVMTGPSVGGIITAIIQ